MSSSRSSPSSWPRQGMQKPPPQRGGRPDVAKAVSSSEVILMYIVHYRYCRMNLQRFRATFEVAPRLCGCVAWLAGQPAIVPSSIIYFGSSRVLAQRLAVVRQKDFTRTLVNKKRNETTMRRTKTAAPASTGSKKHRSSQPASQPAASHIQRAAAQPARGATSYNS